MNTKTINTRIGLKYDLYSKWVAVEESFVPNKGEVIFYEIPAEQNPNVMQTTPPAILFKVGNGDDYLKDLPWGSAIAADVYAWAKQQSLLGGTKTEGVWSFDSTDNTPQTIKDTREEVAAFVKANTVNIRVRIKDLGNNQFQLQTTTSTAETPDETEWVNAGEAFSFTQMTYSAGKGLELNTEDGNAFSVKLKDGVESNLEVDANGLSARVATVTYTAEGGLTISETTGLLNKDAAVAIKSYVDAKAAEATNASEVTISHTSTTEGYLKTYTFTQNGQTLGTVDIPKDFLVKSATINTVTEADKAEGGKFEEDTSFSIDDKYIDFVINTKEDDGTESHVYLNVKDLVDAYDGGETEFITVAVSEDNVITATAKTETLENASAEDGETPATDGLATALNVKQYVESYVGEQLAANVPNVEGQKAIVVTTAEGTTSKTVSLKLNDVAEEDATEENPANVSGLKQSDAGLEIDDQIEWILNCGGAPTVDNTEA